MLNYLIQFRILFEYIWIFMVFWHKIYEKSIIWWVEAIWLWIILINFKLNHFKVLGCNLIFLVYLYFIVNLSYRNVLPSSFLEWSGDWLLKNLFLRLLILDCYHFLLFWSEIKAAWVRPGSIKFCGNKKK